jgi:Mrp family chromosome partitioning ATPase
MKKLPIHYLEVEELFLKTLSRPDIRSLAVTSANSSEGVSTIAYTLSKRAEAEGKKTLLVELDMVHPELRDKSNETHSEWSPDAKSTSKLIMHMVDSSNKNTNLDILPAPVATDINNLRNKDKYVNLLEVWHQHYDAIIFDTSPLNARNQNNIPAENICSMVDGTIIVILAGETKEVHFNKAIDRLKKSKANILGVVFNDQNNPNLASEVVRETRRFDRIFPKTMEKIRNSVKISSFFNIEI